MIIPIEPKPQTRPKFSKFGTYEDPKMKAWRQSCAYLVKSLWQGEKDKIPQCVADWVEINKERGSFEMLLDPYNYDDALGMLGWYGDFNNDSLANEILAKAYLFGYEVEDPLGVLLVDIPENGYCKYNYLYKGESGKFSVDFTDETDIFVEYAHKVTEAEAKEKYPNFKWVSLEELEK